MPSEELHAESVAAIAASRPERACVAQKPACGSLSSPPPRRAPRRAPCRFVAATASSKAFPDRGDGLSEHDPLSRVGEVASNAAWPTPTASAASRAAPGRGSRHRSASRASSRRARAPASARAPPDAWKARAGGLRAVGSSARSRSPAQTRTSAAPATAAPPARGRRELRLGHDQRALRAPRRHAAATSAARLASGRCSSAPAAWPGLIGRGQAAGIPAGQRLPRRPSRLAGVSARSRGQIEPRSARCSSTQGLGGHCPAFTSRAARAARGDAQRAVAQLRECRRGRDRPPREPTGRRAMRAAARRRRSAKSLPERSIRASWAA